MTDNFDVLEQWADNLKSGFKKISGNHQVSFDVLFNKAFMKQYTNFDSIEAFLMNIGVKNDEDFKLLPQAKLEQQVKLKTKFNSWQEMSQTAADQYTQKLVQNVLDS